MNIKDYLHLYLGCEVEISETGERGKLMDISYPNSIDQIYYGILFDGQDEDDIVFPYNDDLSSDCRIKPILRPLSDMTEEEMKLLEKETNGEYHASQGISSDIWTPKEFLFLLSKRFDLFGLIEAGLAIDESTLKQTVLK